MPPLADLVPFIELGGVGLLFIVWYYTFKNSNSTHREISKNNLEAVDRLNQQMVNAYKDSIDLHKNQNDKLMQLIKEDQENQAALIRALEQLRERLNQPIKCPIAEAQKVNKEHS